MGTDLTGVNSALDAAGMPGVVRVEEGARVALNHEVAGPAESANSCRDAAEKGGFSATVLRKTRTSGRGRDTDSGSR